MWVGPAAALAFGECESDFPHFAKEGHSPLGSQMGTSAKGRPWLGCAPNGAAVTKAFVAARRHRHHRAPLIATSGSARPTEEEGAETLTPECAGQFENDGR